MEKIDVALMEFREMDELSDGNSLIHHLNPMVKFIATIIYIMTVVSFDKYDFNRLVIMVIYPVLMFSISSTSVMAFFRRLRFVLPLVMAVGILNPFLDKSYLFTLYGVKITGGMVSMVTLMLKGVFCLMASYVMMATTRFDSFAAALRKMHVPGIIVTLLLLTYRYLSVLMEEVSIMTTAYKLRAPGQKGIHIKAWGSFLGQLLLRSMDRAQELYSAMLLRGFNGNFGYAKVGKIRISDLVYLCLTISGCILFKKYDITAALGNLVFKIENLSGI